MVKVRDSLPKTDTGEIDLVAWLGRIPSDRIEDESLIRKACDFCIKHAVNNVLPTGQPCLEHGLEVAEMLTDFYADEQTLAAAVIYPTALYAGVTKVEIEKALNGSVAKLVAGVEQMSLTHSLYSGESEKQLPYSSQLNADNLRKMLLAMVEDVRVVLIKLAECVCSLKAAKRMPEEHRKVLAREVMEIYAPLANRLGIGQFKWELEDLAFRYLEPTTYKNIASLLDEKRIDREQYIQEVLEMLKAELKATAVRADIFGRAKHIFSIWKKMSRKRVSYDELYDIRAVRILVPEVRDCYAALGCVHALWQHIPKEFDDYIATPKENGYQSLHTAVVGPQGKTLEVQIRTYSMNQEAELGVAAHWRYKEKISHKELLNIENKISWLRQVLEWQSDLADTNDFIHELQSDAFDQRIYVFTPSGDIKELLNGATVLDFAYLVHTEVGHRCRGAKVNGRIVPLTYKLKTGQTVEILTAKVARPSRDWLNPNLGYLKTARARAKVHHWFKEQAFDDNLREGKGLLEREAQKLNLKKIDVDPIASRFNFRTGDDLTAALGAGDIRVQQVINALGENFSNTEKTLLPTFEQKIARKSQFKPPKDITVQGESNILTQIAKCCQPIPGDPVIGFITKSKGITIHRQDCENINQLEGEDYERLIAVEWGAVDKKVYPVDLFVRAYDRQGLLRDVTKILANEHINVIGLTTQTNKTDNLAEMVITIEIPDLSALGKIMGMLQQTPNIFDIKRHR